MNNLGKKLSTKFIQNLFMIQITMESVTYEALSKKLTTSKN